MKEQLSRFWDTFKSEVGSWLDTLVVNLPDFLMAGLVFLVSYIVSKYVNKLMLKILGRTSLQLSVKRMGAKLVSVLVILFGLFLALGILELDKMLTSLLAGAGVAGLAVGLALQGALTNTFSGITLSFVEYLKLGDWVETNGFTGEVVDLNLRTTTLRQIDNNMVSIPNKLVIENPMKNYSVTAQSRVILTCGVAYNSDLEQVRDVVKEAIISNFDAVTSASEILFFYTEFNDSSIDFEVRFTINSTSGLEILKAKGKAIIAIKKAFDQNGIVIPFPIRTIDFSNPIPETGKQVDG
ncbi:mechanosensitive ion channel family protein [Robertkochia sediminum]|uniref:mechanosensitive ion channel family protein n=1 Tax=Robertkochia sediminum TaxID=2785326 RepID=UPI0019330F1D|nr:mechanosensitive ion channel family protein [Robertkochia sediminum]MBL7473082.1 mechanosensitive ion channel family protein [Robertkochia sediminum]